MGWERERKREIDRGSGEGREGGIERGSTSNKLYSAHGMRSNWTNKHSRANVNSCAGLVG